jgi:hypothetical protein
MKKTMIIAAAAFMLAAAAPAQEDGAGQILAANPDVRWDATVQNPILGEQWVFRSTKDNLKIVVPKDIPPAQFPLAKRCARGAVLLWLVQQKDPDPDFMPNILAKEGPPPTVGMNLVAIEFNKACGDTMTLRPISADYDKYIGQMTWEFYLINKKVPGARDCPNVIVTTHEYVTPDEIGVYVVTAIEAVTDYAAKHPEKMAPK